MPARSEPLLWVQLIGAGVFPLEGLLLLLLLAGSDPGPVPALERLLCWGLGAVAPLLLLWRRPADVWSLLLLQTPLRARRPLQQRLSRLQDNLGLRLALALASLLSLPLLWWLDEHAAVASSLSPLAGSPRLVVLLLAALLLALMLWQWQQLLQALWLLTRSPEAIAAARPMAQAELEEQRLCLGLPLLLLDPLQLTHAGEAAARPAAAPSGPVGPVAAPSPAPAVAPTAGSVPAAARMEDSPISPAADSVGGEPQRVPRELSPDPAQIDILPPDQALTREPGIAPVEASVRAGLSVEAVCAEEATLEPEVSLPPVPVVIEPGRVAVAEECPAQGPDPVASEGQAASQAADASPGSADGVAVAIEPEQAAE